LNSLKASKNYILRALEAMRLATGGNDRALDLVAFAPDVFECNNNGKNWAAFGQGPVDQ